MFLSVIDSLRNGKFAAPKSAAKKGRAKIAPPPDQNGEKNQLE